MGPQTQAIATKNTLLPCGIQACPKPNGFSRQDTILKLSATPTRDEADLKVILGGSKSRLKAKFRTRVQIDIALTSQTCVEGGYLSGRVKFQIQRRSKNEPLVWISDAKIRVIGFECISNEKARHLFYHYSSQLSAVTLSSRYPYDVEREIEGFYQAREGEHSLPFSLHLPLDRRHGAPKGVLSCQSGVAVRYIVMVSIKVKDSMTSDKWSYAYSYRDCEVWPQLDLSVILRPAERPLKASQKKGLLMAGDGEVELSVSVHRLHWIAGQQCHARISIFNNTKKTLKTLTMSLIRSTTVYQPDQHAKSPPCNPKIRMDAFRAAIDHKQMAQSELKIIDSGPGLRSRNGTRTGWGGVGPGEHLEISHFLLLPADLLTMPRSRLLEVNYSICVALTGGTLQPTDIQTIVPIRIVNFLSVDPPPSHPVHSAVFASDDFNIKESSNDLPIDCTNVDVDIRHTRTALEKKRERVHDKRLFSGRTALKETSHVTAPALKFGLRGCGNCEDDSVAFRDTNNNPDQPDSSEEDVEEIIRHFLDPEDEGALHFADLYHASTPKKLPREDTQVSVELHTSSPEASGTLGDVGTSVKTKEPPKDLQCHLRSLTPELRPSRTCSRSEQPRGPSTFARRVQEKLDAAVGSSERFLPVSTSQAAEILQGGSTGTCFNTGKYLTGPKEASVYHGLGNVLQASPIMSCSVLQPTCNSTSIQGDSVASQDVAPQMAATLSSNFIGNYDQLRSRKPDIPKTDNSSTASELAQTLPPLSALSNDIQPGVGYGIPVHVPSAPDAIMKPSFSGLNNTTLNHVNLNTSSPAGSPSLVRNRIRELEEKQKQVI